MNPSAQWATLVSLEDVLIVLTSILNLVSEIASMTSLTSDAATRRFLRWLSLVVGGGPISQSLGDNQWGDGVRCEPHQLFGTIPFDKGSKVWHLLSMMPAAR